MKNLVCITLSFLVALLAHAGDAVKHVDVKAAAALVKAGGVTVLDVRTPDEYADGHIAGATNIDFNAPDFEARLQQLDKAKPYLVHCRSGGRSGKSLALFQKLGFSSIHHLDGGIMAWEDAGQPLKK